MTSLHFTALAIAGLWVYCTQAWAWRQPRFERRVATVRRIGHGPPT